uniref:Uncharacterized protein n=1 Tax=Anguilla anguilla TaxID=7936 RepID=A0A0E9XMI7_ANGAN
MSKQPLKLGMGKNVFLKKIPKMFWYKFWYKHSNFYFGRLFHVNLFDCPIGY